MKDAGILKFIRVQNRPLNWKDPEPRRCTLAYDMDTHEVILLGELPHACRITVDQQLVDDLQAVVNLQNGGVNEQGQKTE